MPSSFSPFASLRLWVGLFLLPTLPLVAAAAEVAWVGRFSTGDLAGWRERAFVGRTDYRIVSDAGMRVLMARSQASASGLFFKQPVDLAETPYLHWRWKVDGLIPGDHDERTKAGDDYPARVYVVLSGGLFFWRTRAINYVWASGEPAGSNWPNAFTGNARMVAVESGPARVGQWVGEVRDLREDFRRQFGEVPARIDAVAIMTDSDNTGTAATAWYGDILFSASPEPP